MSEPEREPAGALESLAGSVADRAPVDWEREKERTPDLAPALVRLREIAALEAAHARVREALPAGVRFAWGPLLVLEPIGEGSFAEVFRARDPQLQRDVALKLRRSDLEAPALGARRWIEEARRLARVRHPNVLAVLGADEHDGRAGLWTELLRGRTLEDVLRADGALGPREAAGIAMDLCAALSAVHAAGMIHGDVTTKNVMREGAAGVADRSGRIVLMDFGSALEAHAADLAAFGTPLFAAPEVLAGGDPDARSDLYSLGVVVYRLLTARYPVEGASLADVRTRLERGERTPLRAARPDLPGALVAAVERACEPDPARRFESVAGFEHALAGAIEAGAGAPRRRGLDLRVTLGVAAAIVVVAIAGLAGLQRLRGRTDTPALTAGSRPAPAAEGPATDAAARAEPAPPAAAPASPPAAPEVEAALLRTTAGAREVLRTGDLVAPGDELALEFEARTPVHVYVLSEDEHGAVFVLFPLHGRGEPNPLPPGGRRRLPGGELSWQVTSAGGRETFLLLASRAPLSALADAVAAIPEVRPDAPVAYAPLSSAALAHLRGVGGVVRAPAPAPGRNAGVLAGLARDLGARADARSLWMRLVVLENPAP